MIIPRTHGISDIVAQGSQLRLPLWSQNREFGAPRGKNYSTTSHFHRTMTHLLLSLAEVSPHNEWGVLPWTKDVNPSPKTPPTRLLPTIMLEGFAGICTGQRVTTKNIQELSLLLLHKNPYLHNWRSNQTANWSLLWLIASRTRR